MTTQDPEDEAWEEAAVRAQDLARDGKPDEAVGLLKPLPTVGGSAGHVHERALAWIEIGRAYARAGRGRDAEASLTEATGVIETMKDGVTWEASACRITMASVLREWGKEDEATALARTAAVESAQCQGQDVDCLKNICAAARLIAQMGRDQEAREVLALVSNEEVRADELARLGT